MQNLFYDYAVIRIVPKVDREEFINAGIILSCPDKEFLSAQIELNKERLNAIAPGTDIELVEKHLKAIEDICRGTRAAGKIGQLSRSERFHWLTSPKSTIIQTSPVHSGYCTDPGVEIQFLLKKMVKI